MAKIDGMTGFVAPSGYAREMETEFTSERSATGLSKSRIAAFEQCPKRLWLQVHRPDLAQHDSGTELRFAAGHEVGEVACALVPDGVMIQADPDLAAALAKTAELLAEETRIPLFEATFVHDGVLVRLDIMEPAEDGTWRVAEVKSSTSRKDCYIADLATQLWVLEENGVAVSSAVIRHLDNQFVLEKEGHFDGLLVDVPTLTDARELVNTRAEVARAARLVLAGPEPRREPGDHCTSPYACEFLGYCSQHVVEPEWPISLLPNSGRKLADKWAQQGVTDLTAVPCGQLANPLHARIHEATVTGVPYHDPEGARHDIAEWQRPRSYLDFETIAFAVPRWRGTRPWQQVPFQFSLHVESEIGGLDHFECLCLDACDPRRRVAEDLLRAIPSTGAIIAYNAGFERSCIRQLAAAFSDLQNQLEGLAERVVDLLPVTRRHWYHRDQRGSWSIKAVLPTIRSDPGYEVLAVPDGSAAQAAYLEAIAPGCADWRREQIDRDLRDYCALDTLAMVKLLRHLSGAIGDA
jgi:CRISPR/Cas system-associated exonuclease Cas4 (RecB family)